MNSADKSGPPSDFIDELSVNVTQCEEVECEYGSDTYHILSKTEREKIKKELKKKYSKDDFLDVKSLSFSWKEESYSDDGQTLERIFDSYCETCLPIRNGNLDGRPPKGDEVKIIGCWHEISKKYLSENISDAFIAYRGIGTYDGLVESLLDVFDTDQFTTTLSFTKISNFTLDKSTADFYGTAVVKSEIAAEDVAFAADFLLPYLAQDGHIEKTEAELRVIGERIQTVSTDNIRLPNSDKSIYKTFDQPAQNSLTQHDHAAGLIEILSEYDEEISDTESVDAIRNWYHHYAKEVPTEALSLKEDVESVINQPVGS